jgi:hypothetical protein
MGYKTKNVANTSDQCIQDHGCSFSKNEARMTNAILAITYLVIATVILAINALMLVLCVLKKNRMFATVTAFANYSIVLIFVYNIIGSALSYLSAFDFCYNFNSRFYMCVIKTCLLYFLGVMLTKMMFLIALERLISVRWLQKYKQFLRKKYLFITNFFMTIIGFFMTFSPLFFDREDFADECDCGLNNVLPKPYVLVMNSMVMMIAFTTVFMYCYIYYYVKRSREKISTQCQIRVSLASDTTNNTNTSKAAVLRITSSTPPPPAKTDNKIQILRSQVLLFAIFFGSWLPFIFMTTYENLLDIKNYGVVARIRNFTLILIMISCVLNPLVYVARLKLIKCNIFQFNNTIKMNS